MAFTLTFISNTIRWCHTSSGIAGTNGDPRSALFRDVGAVEHADNHRVIARKNSARWGGESRRADLRDRVEALLRCARRGERGDLTTHGERVSDHNILK